MKLFKSIAATACALALATAAQAATYTDSSANYGEGWSSGSNGGEGFGPWSIEYTSGGEGQGWVGSGIWDPAANEFKGSWEGKTAAFGMIGKGAGYSVKASRLFRASLAPGDSFQLDMGVNWDANIDGAHKGFVLTAGGTDILEINHGNYPGHIYVNDSDAFDVWNEAPDPDKGEVLYPMTWKFTAKDAETLTVSANSRKDGANVYEQDFAVSTSAIDGFRLQSIEQDNQNEDRRQSYYDNFVLDVAGELHDIVELKFTSGEWEVLSATQELSYTLSRSSSEGTLEVAIDSDNEEFVPDTSVTFAEGETSVAFKVQATLSGPGQKASITAKAAGCNSDFYDIKGPDYSINVEANSTFPGTSLTFWLDRHANASSDDSKLTLVSEPEEALELPSEWTWNENEDGSAWVESSLVANASGSAVLYFDGVKMGDYGITVRQDSLKLEGPLSVRAGSENVGYTLTGVFSTGSAPAFTVEISDGSVDPASIDELISDDPVTLLATFPDTPGTVTLSVYNDDFSASLDIEVTEAPDYSKYIAYDDAALYGGEFDFDSTGVGTKGFDAWVKYQEEAENGGVFAGTSVPATLSGILEDGAVLGLYANGTWENNNYKVYRGFNGDLEAGQEFSMDFACEASGGSRFVQLVRWWEGTGYPRFEVYTSDGYVGVSIEGAEGGDIGWGPVDRVVHVSVFRAADSSSYTLSLESGPDSWSTEIPASTENWGDGLQGVIIGAWNSGSDLLFNRLAIEQVEEPVVQRAIGWAAGVWNPDAAGEYAFAVSATTEDIGEVALSVTPSDGALSLSTDTVDLTGVTEASFTVILSEANEGDSFVITATPADTTVSPIEYNVTVSGSYVTLSSDNYEYPLNAGEIWLALTASFSKYGTYAISSSDESVLTVPEASAAITVDSPSQSWFNVEIAGLGEATIYATAEGAEAPAAEFKFTIKPPEYIVLPPFEVIKGRGLAWKASEVAGASFRGTLSLLAPEEGSIEWTDLVEGEDYVTEGEGEDAKTIVLFDGPFFSGHSVGFVMGK